MEELQAVYITALCQEILAQGGLFSKQQVDTIYIGGGTPTILQANLLEEIIGSIKKSFQLAPQVEWTIEANPGTVDEEKLKRLYQCGINRISFGVQTLDDKLLKKIGRIHTAQQAREAITLAKLAGFTNISVDFMYGLPTQKIEDLRCTLSEFMQLDVPHISIYGLKVEENTVFAKLQEQDKLELPKPELDENMYDVVMKTLPEYGYHRYEISNFARSGFESCHNLKYWQNKSYLGLGAAAHSYDGVQRFANTMDVKAYIRKIGVGESPCVEREFLDKEIQMEEFCFLALRMTEGISIKTFNESFACDFFDIYGKVVEVLQKKQLISVTESYVYLTELGMKYGNQVFCEFLLK